MRERLLRRAKYRIRKASDKKGARQSKEMVERPTSGEEASQTAHLASYPSLPHTDPVL